jgi:ribosomal protein S18 acetylase RimI-like enzyme
MENPNKLKQPLSSLTFRTGTEADFLWCAELWMNAVAIRDGTPSDPRVRQRALAKLRVPGSILSIAETGPKTQGFALAIDKTPPAAARRAHLALLVVDPMSQRHGVGRSLLANITHLLVTEGFADATLGVLEENTAARKIYEDEGWQVTGHGVFEDSGRPCIHYLLGLEAAPKAASSHHATLKESPEDETGTTTC